MNDDGPASWTALGPINRKGLTLLEWWDLCVQAIGGPSKLTAEDELGPHALDVEAWRTNVEPSQWLAEEYGPANQAEERT